MSQTEGTARELLLSGVLITVGTGWAYGSAFAYEFGIHRALGIPDALISLQPATFYAVGTLAAIAFLFYSLTLGVAWALPSKLHVPRRPWVRPLRIALSLFGFAVCLVVFAGVEYLFIAAPCVGLGVVTLELLWKSVPFKGASRVRFFVFGVFLFGLLIWCLLVLLGMLRAKTWKNYMILTHDNHEFVVLKLRDDYILGAKFSRQSKSISQELILLQHGTDHPRQIHVEAIGPLKVLPPLTGPPTRAQVPATSPAPAAVAATAAVAPAAVAATAPVRAPTPVPSPAPVRRKVPSTSPAPSSAPRP